jgi:MFS family permease
VYVTAFVIGLATVMDNPARQTFVPEMVGPGQLQNAISLNSANFQSARLVGPAVAGVLIGQVGTGWVFLLNAASFAAVLVALSRLSVHDLHRTHRAELKRGSLGEGVRYVRRHADLVAVLAMLFLIATFGLNFPIFISTMAVNVFHAGAHEYGLLSSMMAVGSVTGALLSARRAQPRMSLLIAGAGVFGAGCLAAALMPAYWLFGATLVVIGIASQTFMTTANSTVQLATDPLMRGRVMAIYMAIALGATPLGAPIVGWVADAFGPRWALGVAAAAGACAGLVGWRHLRRMRQAGVSAAPATPTG